MWSYGLFIFERRVLLQVSISSDVVWHICGPTGSIKNRTGTTSLAFTFRTIKICGKYVTTNYNNVYFTAVNPPSRVSASPIPPLTLHRWGLLFWRSLVDQNRRTSCSQCDRASHPCKTSADRWKIKKCNAAYQYSCFKEYSGSWERVAGMSIAAKGAEKSSKQWSSENWFKTKRANAD